MAQARSLLVLILLVGLVAPAPSTPAERDPVIREVMKLSGLEQQIKSLPQQVLEGFEKDGKRLPAPQYQQLRRMLLRAFDPATLETQVYQGLSKNLDRVVAKRSMEWLRSDLGRKITKLEEQAARAETARELEAYAKQIKGAPPSQERLMLVRQLDFATHATDTHIDILEATTFSIAAAVDATLPNDQRQGQDRLRIIMDRQRPKWREASQELTALMLLHTYQTLSDQELERYIEFLETEVGREYQVAANAALKEALYLAIDRMSAALVEILKPAGRRKVA